MPQNDLTTAHTQIGKKLRQLRKTQGKSIKDAAKEAGIAPRTLVKIENGEVNFRILTLLKLCKAYNLTVANLLKNFALGRKFASIRRKQRQ